MNEVRSLQKNTKRQPKGGNMNKNKLRCTNRKNDLSGYLYLFPNFSVSTKLNHTNVQ